MGFFFLLLLTITGRQPQSGKLGEQQARVYFTQIKLSCIYHETAAEEENTEDK